MKTLVTLIYGEAGTGKTTMAKLITNHFDENNVLWLSHPNLIDPFLFRDAKECTQIIVLDEVTVESVPESMRFAHLASLLKSKITVRKKYIESFEIEVKNWIICVQGDSIKFDDFYAHYSAMKKNDFEYIIINQASNVPRNISGFILKKEYPGCKKKVGDFEKYTTGEFLKYPEIWEPVYS